nr:hypothetical protein [Kibdelosporangium sp. MJ126-NF4]CTQ99116.1 hypothetical protein [Kibdelosporangium sp. MJ126-NF4]
MFDVSLGHVDVAHLLHLTSECLSALNHFKPVTYHPWRWLS